MTDNKNTSKYQGFETRVIHRSEIKNAPYNPRQMGEEARKRLRQNMKRLGLITTLVWNEQTGNVLSGNQRLRILDGLERKKDYYLTVAVVTMDEKTEKEQNIFMNSLNAQGRFDLEAVDKIFPDIDPDAAGITEEEIRQFNLGVNLDDNIQDNDDAIEDEINRYEQAKQQETEQYKKDNPDVVAKDRQRVNEGRKQVKDEQKESQHINYVVLSFDDAGAKEAFLKRWGFNANLQHVKGEEIEKTIQDKINQAEE